MFSIRLYQITTIKKINQNYPMYEHDVRYSTFHNMYFIIIVHVHVDIIVLLSVCIAGLIMALDKFR